MYSTSKSILLFGVKLENDYTIMSELVLYREGLPSTIVVYENGLRKYKLTIPVVLRNTILPGLAQGVNFYIN